MKSFIVFLMLFFSNLNFSHEMNPARLVLTEDVNSNYKVTWMFPSKGIGLPAEVSFPDCTESNKSLPNQESKYLITNLNLNCGDSIKGKSITLKGLSRITDALISVRFFDGSKFEGLASVNDSSLVVPKEISLYPTSYFWLGIQHLLSGLDHMLFVFGLLFLILGIKALIKTITAFTVAHSITLTLSVLGLVSLPQASTEAFIALTLIYLAFEVGDQKKYDSTPWLLAFGFGLLFNLGIEAGQLMIVPVFGVFVLLINNLSIKDIGYKYSSYLIGGLGSFWLIERVLKII
jgi:hypothetical protein